MVLNRERFFSACSIDLEPFCDSITCIAIKKFKPENKYSYSMHGVYG